MPANRVTRRVFAAGGLAAGVFATPFLAATAQDTVAVARQATPIASVPIGYVSARLRTLSSPDLRGQVNDRVLEELIPEVEALAGFRGYVLGDVVESDDQNLAISVMENMAEQEAFDAVAREFVAGLGDLSAGLKTQEWAGELQLAEGPAAATAPPAATPVGPMTQGYVTLRTYRRGGTDPLGLVPQLVSGFLPIISGIAGFEGYLWYLTDDGFAAISLFDAIESAEASTEAAREWAAENATQYFEGDPIVINADVVYANLPILR